MERYQSKDACSYCLGMSLTIELLKKKPQEVLRIILSEKAYKNEQLGYLLRLCEENDIKPEYDDRLIEKLSLKENCYCIGIFKKFYTDLSGNDHILLYGFKDFGELGTILRSAISFDFHDLILINSDIDYFDPRCIRSSMGAIFHTNIKRYENLDSYLEEYADNIVYPFVSKGSKELNDLKLTSPYSIIIPERYDGLDDIYEDGYHVEHHKLEEMSMSVRSSIVLSYIYDLKRRR